LAKIGQTLPGSCNFARDRTVHVGKEIPK
jgi:hypothetical protein